MALKSGAWRTRGEKNVEIKVTGKGWGGVAFILVHTLPFLLIGQSSVCGWGSQVVS